MCKPIHKHFTCICPNRNEPSCPHHKYLRSHPEFIVADSGQLKDEKGWFYRMCEQGQSYTGWQPYCADWQHCIHYKLANKNSKTGGILLGREILCSHDSNSA
ncbi:hypothetical protein QBC38DRAFT_328926, partial [Podospora fimiseda]